MPGFRSLGCTNDQERRNFSKIRDYGEIFDDMERRCGNLKGRALRKWGNVVDVVKK
jgi:hypothetical protein